MLAAPPAEAVALLALPLDPLVLLAEAPANPEYTVCPPVVVAPATALLLPLPLADVLIVLLIVLVLTRTGLCAPQGCWLRQLEEHWLSDPQLDTHWVPQVWQTKKGMVWEYSVRLGELPSEQTQAYVRVVGSQELALVCEDAAAVWRQML